MPVQIQLRRGTQAEWTANSGVVLAAGEMGIETNTYRYKIGNGASTWAALGYASLPDQTYSPSTFTTKGQLLVGAGASLGTVLAVGSNGRFLVANSATASGLEWQSTLTGASLSACTMLGNTLVNSGASVSIAGTLAVTGTATFSSATISSLTAPGATITGGTFNTSLLSRPKEPWQVNATALSGTVGIDVSTSLNWLYTGSTNANFTLNFTNVNAALANNESLTLGVVVTNGATGGYPTAVQVAGVVVTVRWQGNAAPSVANPNARDAYVFTLIKTATDTYTVLGSQTKFS
jgi:hypothetical protein